MTTREELQRVRELILPYQEADDGVVKFIKGFAAKAGDVDPYSRARQAIALLDGMIQRADKYGSGTATGASHEQLAVEAKDDNLAAPTNTAGEREG